MFHAGAGAPGVDSVETASLTDTGRERSHNEDAWTELHPPDGSLLLMVADGMGGHAGGETASRLAVETVRAVVEAEREGSEALLRRAFEEANLAIHDAARADASLHGMGTTGVALLLAPSGLAWVAHVGDSRAYRLRGARFEPLTEDHSFVAELQRRGVIDADEAAVHPRRHQVLRSLGIEPTVDVEVQRLELEAGDRLLLCSDGLTGVVEAAEIADLLGREAPEQAVRSLVDLANQRGGPDNITVQIARLPQAGAAAHAPWRSGRLWLALLAAVLVLGSLWGWLARP